MAATKKYKNVKNRAERIMANGAKGKCRQLLLAMPSKSFLIKCFHSLATHTGTAQSEGHRAEQHQQLATGNCKLAIFARFASSIAL